MEILFEESLDFEEKTLQLLTEAATLCVEKERLDPSGCEVSLSIVSKEEIRALNDQFRGVDAVTDVLSFPQYDTLEDLDPRTTEVILGDIVICDDKVREQAEEYGHSYEREFVYLFVHSMHHLLGYDHMEEDEKQEMREGEELVMKSLGLAR